MEWISVNDRLPAKDEPVICWVRDVGVNLLYLSVSISFKEDGTRTETPTWFPATDLDVIAYLLDDVTHWMPYPKPPVNI